MFYREPQQASASSFNGLSLSKTITPAFDIATDFFDPLSNGDIATAARAFADDGVLLFPGMSPIVGRKLVKRMLGIIRRRYANVDWAAAAPPIASGEWIVASWVVTGSFRDEITPYENEGVSLIHLDKTGRIKVLSEYYKDTLEFASRFPAFSAKSQSLRQTV